MRHGKIQTAENSYGHLFAQDREPILRGPMNQAVTRLYAHEETEARLGQT